MSKVWSCLPDERSDRMWILLVKQTKFTKPELHIYKQNNIYKHCSHSLRHYPFQFQFLLKLTHYQVNNRGE